VFTVGHVDELAGHLYRLAADDALRVRLGDGAMRHIARFDVAATAAGTVRAIRALAVAADDEAHRRRRARLVA
jgi:hypothetical protein